ncbi:hypothetical protein Tco_0289555 [Tanacetum coccineum]
METKNTSSSRVFSVRGTEKIPETSDASKDFQENSLNKLNALKSTTINFLKNRVYLYHKAFAQLFLVIDWQYNQCKVQEVQSSVTSSGDETSSGIVSDEEIDKQKLEAHSSYMAKIQEVSPDESSSTSQPLEQKANASLTQELKECKTNLDETSRALGEATSSRDSCLIALQTKQTELEK